MIFQSYGHHNTYYSITLIESKSWYAGSLSPPSSWVAHSGGGGGGGGGGPGGGTPSLKVVGRLPGTHGLKSLWAPNKGGSKFYVLPQS